MHAPPLLNGPNLLREATPRRIQMSVSIAGILTALGIKVCWTPKETPPNHIFLGITYSKIPVLAPTRERLLRVKYAIFTTLKIRFPTK